MRESEKQANDDLRKLEVVEAAPSVDSPLPSLTSICLAIGVSLLIKGRRNVSKDSVGEAIW